MKMYVHVPYIYVLGTVRQCKEDFVTVQLPCKPTYTWYIPVKAFSRHTLCRRYAAKDHILFNQNEKHDFNQILAYHFRIPAYHTTRFLIRIMSYTGIIPVNIPHCARCRRSVERAMHLKHHTVAPSRHPGTHATHHYHSMRAEGRQACWLLPPLACTAAAAAAVAAAERCPLRSALK